MKSKYTLEERAARKRAYAKTYVAPWQTHWKSPEHQAFFIDSLRELLGLDSLDQRGKYERVA
jgi:hypothetical protein